MNDKTQRKQVHLKRSSFRQVSLSWGGLLEEIFIKRAIIFAKSDLSCTSESLQVPRITITLTIVMASHDAKI